MFVSEIFYSIQGEGELTGVPSVFVRTSGCNLRCNWCDTMYASWNPEGTEMSIDQILTEVTKHPAHHCVLTGGEPMIAKGIRELSQALRDAGKHVTIETAATIPPADIHCDLASLSPKLRNSAPDQRLSDTWHQKHEQLRLQPAVIREWISQYPYQLKFVVSAKSDFEEIHLLLSKLNTHTPSCKVLLMPEGISREAMQTSNHMLIEICKQYGYRYCNRLHVEIFGHTRGT